MPILLKKRKKSQRSTNINIKEVLFGWRKSESETKMVPWTQGKINEKRVIV